MSKEDNGGTAFPAQFWYERAAGMNLRDYFAANALQGLLSDSRVRVDEDQDLDDFAGEVAEASYIYADAMLEARKK